MFPGYLTWRSLPPSQTTDGPPADRSVLSGQPTPRTIGTWGVHLNSIKWFPRLLFFPSSALMGRKLQVKAHFW